MKNSRWMSLVVTLMVFLFAVSSAGAGSQIEEQLQDLVERNLETAENEDFEAHMATYHEDSPLYAETKQLTVEAFNNFELEYELLDFSWVAETDRYQLAKVHQLTEDVSDAAFRDNKVKALWVFRELEGEWKIWSTATLEEELI